MVEKAAHSKDLNPFAADEDDDSDGDGEFTIGDLEVEEEGKGHLPPGTSLVGDEHSLLFQDDHEKNVGSPSGLTVISSTSFLGTGNGTGRQNFPSMWPFGGPLKSNGEQRGDVWGEEAYDRSHFRGAHADVDSQSSDEDSDDEYTSGKFGNGQGGGKRRLSVTTEAKRRVSLDDDDEDEVVHVGMSEAASEVDSGKVVGEGDEELVEIQHAEMQVERESVK